MSAAAYATNWPCCIASCVKLRNGGPIGTDQILPSPRETGIANPSVSQSHDLGILCRLIELTNDLKGFAHLAKHDPDRPKAVEVNSATVFRNTSQIERDRKGSKPLDFIAFPRPFILSAEP
jgi:hypothetical protein